MKLGEVALWTEDVPRLSDFYRKIFGLPNLGERDTLHQAMRMGDTTLAVEKCDGCQTAGQRMTLAFTVEDIQATYARLTALGVEIAQKPTKRPWGATNMSFIDPDGNKMYVRQLDRPQEET